MQCRACNKARVTQTQDIHPIFGQILCFFSALVIDQPDTNTYNQAALSVQERTDFVHEKLLVVAERFWLLVVVRAERV